LETDGVLPVKHLLDLVDPIATIKDVWDVVTKMEKEQLDSCFFIFSVYPDYANSSVTVANLDAPAIQFIDKHDQANILVRRANNSTVLQKFEVYMKSIFMLAGYSDQDSAKHASNQVNIESQLQKIVIETKQLPGMSVKKTLAQLKVDSPNKSLDSFINSFLDSIFI
jgi:predicted metalloendopeptidase